MGFEFPPALVPAPRPHGFVEQDYLIGVRGLLAVQSFLWVFLTTFVPATVANAANSDGPLYQKIIRKTFSVLFWNDALIYSTFIFLSARTLCLPFLKDGSRQTIASSVFRRGLRMWFPTAVSFALATLIFSQSGVAYIDDFKTRTGNVSIATPRQIPSFLNWFNSMFDVFWVTKFTNLQAANTAFPSQTLWTITTIYEQSFTIYMSMVIIPYTRRSWRVKAFGAFVITAWWVQSWAWYSIAGLFMADAVVNMSFREKARRGIKVARFTFPTWPIYGFFILAGYIMEYLWVAWRPDLRSAELKGHTGLYNAGSLNAGFDTKGPQARDDNFLIIIGFFLCLEHFEVLQRIFRMSVFQYLGKRSFSFFLMQSIIIYTAGIKMFAELHFAHSIAFSASTFLCLVVCIPLVALTTEVFYRLVDYPSTVLAHLVFDWIRT
ncbi:uncharacterized protein BDZ99DRAFT_416727 [Mytilinidion resinicola]|uniref:Acyltransferase 3 domain-containing protein n=1 Tax=Mytilinidion resinicola TaxID=574789 RepID=A0A6A6YQU6_9PEZI|nr:uncharacterized protein BDZ99DRAFT_416727 [Mytilinidion resinicola]KAF2810384.1 hypothetical protein BDZ99DRAFT_416727 [Mytilinidion resinicola]